MKILLPVLLLLTSPLVYGAAYYKMTPGERRLCIAMFGVRHGSGGHICDCVRFYNKAMRETKASEIKYYAQSTVGSCTYFLEKHSEFYGYRFDQYVPTALMYRGMGYLLEHKRDKAIVDLNGAIVKNPKLQPAYLQLADIWSGLGNKAKALEIITQGLKNLPGSKSLRRRYLELGGKKPFPAPEQQHATEAPRGTANPQSVMAAPAKGGNAGQPMHSAAGKERSTSKPSPTVNPKQPPIGIKGDPWCRFCPDLGPDQPDSTAGGSGK